MKSLGLIVGAALGAAMVFCGAVAADTLYLTNGNIVDATRDKVFENATLRIEDGKIAEILSGETDFPADAEVIDLEGRHIVPGMVDMHSHPQTIDQVRFAMETGVTTIRVASGGYAYSNMAIRDLINAGELVGPEMFLAGVFVQPNLMEAAALDDARLWHFVNKEVWSAEDLATVVNVNIDRGANWIKTRATERAGLAGQDPRRQVYSEGELRVIVDTAAKRNIPVGVHAHGVEGVRAAVMAGARSIEHGTYADNETLQLMKEKGTWLVPTLAIIRDPGVGTAPLLVRSQHMIPAIQDMARRAHKIGVRMVTGSDTNYDRANSPVRVSHELAEMVDIGMSPRDALAAATINGAEMLGIHKRTGRIEVGFEADLMVVDGNPLKDITRMQDALLVLVDGKVGLKRVPFGRAE